MNAAYLADTTRDWLHRCVRSAAGPVPMPPRAVPKLALHVTSEATRRAQFEQSAATRNGVVTPFPCLAAAPATPSPGAAAGFYVPEESK